MRKKICLMVMVLMSCVRLMGQAPGWEWAKSAKHSSDDGGTSIIVDAEGNTYIAGYFVDSTITFGSFTLMSHGAYDFFVVKYDSSGNAVWAKNAKGTGYVEAWDLALDAAGNLYVTGSFFRDTIVFGNYVLTNPDLFGDLFLVKYDSAGNVIWARSSNGSDNDQGYRIKTDPMCNVYIAGSFESPVIDFGNVSLINASSNGDGDPFIVKYDSSGTAIWAKAGTGILIEGSNGITGDANGNSYIIGQYISPAITFGAYTLFNNGSVASTDMFLVKYNSIGNEIWAKGFGGTGIDYFSCITSDLSGSIYIAGSFKSPSISFDTIVLNNLSTGSESFILKLDSSGNSIWATVVGTPSNQAINSLETDLNGNLYAIGYYTSSSITFGNYTLTNTSTFSDLFIVKYNGSGNVLWAKSEGGNKNDYGYDIALDFSGNSYITGYFESPSIVFGNDTLNNNGLGTRDFFVAKLDSTVIIGLNEYGYSSTITLFPNPTTSYFTITSSVNIDQIEITDVMGRVVYRAKPKDKKAEVVMKDAGIYFVTVITNNQTFTKKMLVVE